MHKSRLVSLNKGMSLQEINQPEPMSSQERKEYSLDLFARVREMLLDALTLENMPEELRREMQETADGYERLLELVHKL